MDLDEIDRSLARLHQAATLIGSNLVELESDGVRTRLDQAKLTGMTSDRWSDAKEALARLWQWFSQLNDLLERADRIRGKKARVDAERVAQLTALVATPSIELSSADIPLAERGLLGARQITRRCTPDELLASMTAAFDQVEATIGAAGDAWGRLEARLQVLNNELAEIATLARTLGPEHQGQLARLADRLGRLGDAVASDPLSVDPADLDPVEVSLESVGRDIESLADLRDGMAERFGQAGSLLDELRGTMTAGAGAHRHTIERIAAPDVPEPLSIESGLERQLDQAKAAAGAGDWRAARRLLADWTEHATALSARAHQVLDANRAPIEVRDELRGRLDAYRAKAFRLGLLENGTVAGLYERAYQALYRAPTDLAGATALVLRYQQAIAALARHEEPREV